jgi:hypothetical protein
MMAVHESKRKVRDTAFWHLQALKENSLTPLSSRHLKIDRGVKKEE